jgi:hypothetical protein
MNLGSFIIFFIFVCVIFYLNIFYVICEVNIYNIRTLSVNIKFICTSFRNRQNSKPFGELFRPVSQWVQKNFTFNDNVHILCLSCNVKKGGKLVRFKQKGQKQASFLTFHKCCHGCLLRGPRYISTGFILVCTLRYRVPGKFIRRLKSLFVSTKSLFV